MSAEGVDPMKTFNLLKYFQSNDTDAISQLLHSDSSDSKDSSNSTQGILLLAVKAANPSTIQQIISFNGIDINETDPDGNTPLHIASSLGRSDVVELLINSPSINDSIRNNHSRSAIQVCKSDACALIIHDSQSKLNDEFRHLVAEYIRPSSQDKNTGQDLIDLLKLPCSPIIDLSYIDSHSGSTLLHSAVTNKDFPLLKAAFENANASSSIVDSRNLSLLSSCKDDQIKSFVKLQERQKPNAHNFQSRNKKGTLKKYVNLATGWHNRHFVLQDGILNYYLSAEDEAKQLSRGAINLEYGKLKEDKGGDSRKFEIHSHNNKFLVRADHPTDAASWKQAISLTVQDINNGDKNPSMDAPRSPFLYDSSSSIHGRHDSRTSLADFQSQKGGSDSNSIAETVESYNVNAVPHNGTFEHEGQKLSAHIEATESLINTFLKDDFEGDNDTHNERKEALKGSIQTLSSLIAGWQSMVNEREIYYRKSLQHERETAKLWEENIATIAVETAKVEGELENVHKAQEDRRKALKHTKHHLHGAAAGTSTLSPPMKAAVIDSKESAPARAEGNIYAAHKQDESGVSAPPQAAHHAPINDDQRPSPMARVTSSSEDDDDDDDDFFDAVEEGNLPMTQEVSETEKKHDPPVEDLTPYVPYEKLRDGMPISDDKRPPMSLWSVLKSSIGKDLTKISFPVTFNEPTSMLQRMAEDMEFTECLDAAVNSQDPLKRVAYVAAFAASNYSSTMNRIAKPFNPMLGETFEYCRFDKQYRYFSEQVSHHPPMSACWGENPRWIYKGEVDAKNKFMGTSFEIRPTGIAHAELKIPAAWAKEGVTYPREKCKVTGEELIIEHYSWKKVTTAVTGFVTASPVIDHFGDMVVLNHRTGESCTLTFKARPWRGKGQEIKGFVTNSQKKREWVIAGRWVTQLVAKKVDNETDEINADQQVENSSEYLLLWKNSAKPKTPFNLPQFAITLNDLPGDRLSTMKPIDRPDLRPWLPSTDCRLRPDQRAFEIGLYDLANDLKIRNEEKQRGTRKEREMGKLPPHKPRWFNAVQDPDTGERVWMPTTTKTDNGHNQIEYWSERESVGRSRREGDSERQFKDVDDIFVTCKIEDPR